MGTFHYTPPLAPTSVDAPTVTQTLTRLGQPETTTFITLTTLTLSKSQPTSVESSSTQILEGLPHSAVVRVIVGSVLGFMVLPILIYYCCLRTPASAIDESDEPGADPVGLVIKEGSPQLTRPRRKKRAPMDLAYGSVPGRAYIFL